MNQVLTVISDLLQALGPDVVTTGDALDRPTSYWNSQPASALALLRPRTTAEVSQALTICAGHKQALVTQGGMTNCVQSADASPGEIILSTERLTRIECIDVEASRAVVEAGVVLQVLQEACREKALRFPLDLGARGSCTVGGNAATNAGGINALRYGMMRDLVLGLEVVLADGSVITSLNSMLKNNAGYDLKQLFIGSEGTLGVITRLVLKLYPEPRSCQTALVALQDFAAVTTLLQTLQREINGALSAFELMWGDYFAALTEPGGHRAPLDRNYPFYVLLEMEGANTDNDAEHFFDLLERALEGGMIVDAVLAKSEAERRALWDIRENFDAVLERKPTWIYDVSLPLPAMPAYIEQVKAGLQHRWPDSRCLVFGHVADGNLHIFVSPGVADAKQADCDYEIYTPLNCLQGSISAEHGVGLEKKQWLRKSRSPEELALMCRLKRSLDPDNLLNPGRVFDL